jgi:hypothetical protein
MGLHLQVTSAGTGEMLEEEGQREKGEGEVPVGSFSSKFGQIFQKCNNMTAFVIVYAGGLLFYGKITPVIINR